MNRMIDSSYYRERAQECAQQIEATSLANVRKKIAASQNAWLAMAERADERAESVRVARLEA